MDHYKLLLKFIKDLLGKYKNPSISFSTGLERIELDDYGTREYIPTGEEVFIIASNPTLCNEISEIVKKTLKRNERQSITTIISLNCNDL